MNKIITKNIWPPIPTRHFDWCASLDGHEEGPHGFGETEQESIDDLKEQLEETEPTET